MEPRIFQAEKLTAYVYPSRQAMGQAAGKAAAEAINRILGEKDFANVIFAAAPSQNEALEALLAEDVDFSRIRAFHMDEYVGLGMEDSQSFARYLFDHIFSRAPFAQVHYIPAKEDGEAACAAYSALLTQYPPDVVCLGIGENGHIAFNDPPVADFADPQLVKVVELDPVCRMQQVHDGCFPCLDAVPKHAVTLTVPALLGAKHLICTVPAATKADAVKAMLDGPYGEACPATSLRRHDSAVLFLDPDSAGKV